VSGAGRRRRVAELRPGERVDSIFVVARKALCSFRDPARGCYLALWLADATGQVKARVWEGASEIAPSVQVERPFRAVGTVEVFRDGLELNLERLEPVAEGDVHPEDFLPVGARNPDEMAAEIGTLCRTVSEPSLRALLESLLSDTDFLGAFLRAPAAKVIHHAYLGGLAEHSLEVATVVLTMAELYPSLDRDLTLCGALLHDVGKIHELRYDWVIEYTDRGRLLGHTVLGYQLIAERLTALAFPEELGYRLLHLILSHHGEPSWGAPVVPQTLEAAVLAHADLLSGRTRQFHRILQSAEEQKTTWTPYDRVLERYLYRGTTGGRQGRYQEPGDG